MSLFGFVELCVSSVLPVPAVTIEVDRVAVLGLGASCVVDDLAGACDVDLDEGCVDGICVADDAGGLLQATPGSFPLRQQTDLAFAGDVDCSVVTVPEATTLAVAVGLAAGGCPTVPLRSTLDGGFATIGTGCQQALIDVVSGNHTLCVESAAVGAVQSDVLLLAQAVHPQNQGEACVDNDASNFCDPRQILECNAGFCVVRPDDHGDRSSPTAVIVPAAKVVNLDPGDEDCFVFDVLDSGQFTFTTGGVGDAPCPGDTELLLLDAAGGQVRLNDNFDGGVCSQIDVALTAGSFRLCASSFNFVSTDDVEIVFARR